MSVPRRPGESAPPPRQPGPAPRGQAGPAGASSDPRSQNRPARDPVGGRVQTQPPPVPPPTAVQRQPIDLATRLDGQRGWLKELDESLKKRSIIALVLTCLAVGVGAAALYVSITKNADGDRITALEERIDALETATGGGPAATTPDTGTTTTPGTALPGTGTTDPATGTTSTPGVTPGSTTPGTTPSTTLPGE